ncbi:MAG: hypothetical protein HOK41_08305 [Nitrospina sp.]|nr:hypothetical protein [Nitrospina sp.]
MNSYRHFRMGTVDQLIAVQLNINPNKNNLVKTTKVFVLTATEHPSETTTQNLI